MQRYRFWPVEIAGNAIVLLSQFIGGTELPELLLLLVFWSVGENQTTFLFEYFLLPTITVYKLLLLLFKCFLLEYFYLSTKPVTPDAL